MATQKNRLRGPSGLSRPLSAFNEAYYRRYYRNPETRVRSAAADGRLARFVFGYLEHLGIPVRRVVDLGCGLGQWRGRLALHHPRAAYTGVDISPYLCAKYGWEESSAADFRGRGRYDLVLCQSVFQYLGDAEARIAVENLARLCRGALYLEIITEEDWELHCNRRMTDGNVHLRGAGWYRKLLGRRFRSAGGGIFLPKDSPAVLYELERGYSSR
ncbi:MAG TPA: class I SAM-dependent methyltransferase [Fibrobacteria bacterium]|nr:class I SAM-dependent methyltransferase [Fibrobacteria bacterium]